MFNDHLAIMPKEMIDVRFWELLSQQLEDKFQFVPNEHIHDVFRSTYKFPQNVISAFSDFGIHEQEKDHPNSDLAKLAQRCDWDVAMSTRGSYAAINVGPACKTENCNPTHKFSVKMDSYTISTLPCLPNWLKHWYSTNLNIVDERATCIPFGLNDHGPGLGMLPSFRGRKKTGLLYVNFQDNTTERFHLKEYYKRLPWVTFRDNANLPVDQYLEEVASHKFVLSPPGNGLDCYRNYEAMYLGSIPILKRSVFTENLAKLTLPFVSVDSMIIRNPDENVETWLHGLYDAIVEPDWNYGPLTKSYWRERIQRENC